ncbi:hypothetical protein L596_013424 [Steinernema carpocapsae]|uniref:Uncharacterized protein n=1 Tax=Steinernema carpocapsae TaxID=34508 RepID=A0A4U5P061_STECR|nr:hypothetical protein L596_013424 [Steinernema carpocapsae]
MRQDRAELIFIFSVFVCVSVFLVLYVDESDIKTSKFKWAQQKAWKYQSMLAESFNVSGPENDTSEFFYEDVTIVEPMSSLGCELKRMDPWDPQIKGFINPPDLTKPCVPKQAQITDLVNGTVVLNRTLVPNGYDCQGRCLWHINDWDVNKTTWENITTFKPKCDIVEVWDEFNYGPHSGNETSLPGWKPTTQQERPNVYVLVFDSTSQSNFIRSMQRTLYYMKEQHEAVIFRHLNKINLNSRPNAWGFMFGKQIGDIAVNPYSEAIPADVPFAASCNNPSDDQDWWGHRLRDLGYHTLMSDDWKLAALMWSNCWGFKKPGGGAKHYQKPYQTVWEKTSKIKNTGKKMCHQTFHDQSLYLDQFMSAYQNESQMAFMWNSELAHDVLNGLYRADDTYYRLLKKHEERLNNSFVIIQGDHGMRFGSFRKTHVGELEDNNPFLMISVPVKYRKYPFLQVLRDNSLKLITHFDTHASLMHLTELIGNNTLNELRQPKTELFRRFHGTSYFRARMAEPRDCGTLHIPYPYCLCKKEFAPPLNFTNPVTLKLENFAMKHIQDMINAKKATNLCYKLTILANHTVAEKIVTKSKKNMYRLKVTAEPSQGVFTGFVELVEKKGKTEFIVMGGRLAREDTYGNQGDCVIQQEDIRPYCYCKNQKKS